MPEESVFICYRRDDSSETAGRIFDRLKNDLPAGAVFRDLDSIPLGADFRVHVERKLAGARVVLVLIGRDWLTIRDVRERLRLEDAADHVRVEVEMALRTPNVMVIPILCRDAQMPAADDLPPKMRDLAFKNGQSVRRDPDFHRDVDHLLKHIRKILDEPVAEEVAKPEQVIAIALGEKATPLPEKNAAANLTAPIANPDETGQGKNDAIPLGKAKVSLPPKAEEQTGSAAASALKPTVVPPKPVLTPWEKTVELVVFIFALACWGLALWGALLGIRYAAIRAGEGIEWAKKKFAGPAPAPTLKPTPTPWPKVIVFPSSTPSFAERMTQITKPSDATPPTIDAEVRKLFSTTPTPRPNSELTIKPLPTPTPTANDAPPKK